MGFVSPFRSSQKCPKFPFFSRIQTEQKEQFLVELFANYLRVTHPKTPPEISLKNIKYTS